MSLRLCRGQVTLPRYYLSFGAFACTRFRLQEESKLVIGYLLEDRVAQRLRRIVIRNLKSEAHMNRKQLLSLSASVLAAAWITRIRDLR